MYYYRIKKYIALQRIGRCRYHPLQVVKENQFECRESVCKDEFMGIKLDNNVNKVREVEAITADSKVKVVVIPTDETC